LNIETGLSSNDLDIRVQHFGTNKKDPPVRTPFCVFFWKALDDFMLKLLLVCAVINIGFEVGFAEDDKHRKTGKSLTFFPSMWIARPRYVSRSSTVVDSNVKFLGCKSNPFCFFA
jgi:hypothetical protein